MSLNRVLEKHRNLLLITLLVISILQAALNLFAIFVMEADASDAGNTIYEAAYIFICILWVYAGHYRLNSSFDQGWFYLATYPFYIMFGLFKTLGFLKGVGFFLLLLVGYVFPSVAPIVVWDILYGGVFR